MTTTLIIGASRGLGLGLTRELLGRGQTVIATARKPSAAEGLQALARTHPDRLRIEMLDIDDAAALEAFPARLGGTKLDTLFINAGVSGPGHRSAMQATAAETGLLMFTNAIAPIRLARLLADRVRQPGGTIAFMSSRMGSVAENTGGHELYRASKAALNSLSRGLWTELEPRGLTLLTLHPGWVRTDMGGPNAAVDVESSVRGIADVLERHRNARQHLFRDYTDAAIAW